MSVIAALAEFPELRTALRRDDVGESFTPISGRFQVIRFDIGASNMSLRDIVCVELTKGLAERGVEYAFKSLEHVTNTKDSLVEMMSAFESVFPNEGLLFVLDEMLDFLRGRKDGELIQDLAFLREVGEICKNTRFRFIGGLQESLFDNPRFAGVADAIRRVRDRFEQVRIAREDVAFVVRERLLPKSAAQKTLIREHLTPFTPLFDGMSERMDEFVDLYPLHPSYLATFEQLTLVEKREVLRTVEGEIRRLADVEIPQESPGVVCIDSYRARLVDDPSARTIPEVQEVLDKSEVVRNKIATAMPEKQYVDTATRIVDALAVHRLTTDDIRARIGLTVDELRDQLCLLPPGLPKVDAMFLHTTIESIINKTLLAVSGQFLSRNEANGQIYLDIDKDIDYDQLIAQRAESLDDNRLDAAYYTSMESALGISDDPYVAGYKIWAYLLPWPAKNSDRLGYLFMGAPNERSTAQPPRDFYLYFLQPFDLPKYIDEERTDEIFLRLEGQDDEFTAALRRYAGALELAKESTADRRPIYEQKAREAQQDIVSWLRTNLSTAMSVTYRGDKRTIDEWLKVVEGDRASVAQQLRSITAHILVEHFEERFPGYPKFGVEITPANLGQAVQASLTQLADPARATTASRKLLASLSLLGSDDAATADGEFAEALLKKLEDAGGKVVNRSELLSERDPGLLSWAPWHLEPAWLVVVAAALVHLGKAELSYPSMRIDALGLDQLTKMSMSELVEFGHLAPPTALPTQRLATAAEVLGILPGAVPPSGATAALVTEFGTRAAEFLGRVVEAEKQLSDGVELWGTQIIDLVDERQARLKAARSFAEDIKGRNSVGKLNKFSLDDNALNLAKAGRNELLRLDTLQKAVGKLEPIAGYLREAVACFGDSFAQSTEAQSLRDDMIAALTTAEIKPPEVSELAARAQVLRSQFAAAAGLYFHHSFLDSAGDKRKQQLLQSSDWGSLSKLASITLLQGGQFVSIQSDLAGINTLMEIDSSKLRDSVKIGAFVPGEVVGSSAEARLEGIEHRVTELLSTWRTTLVDNVAEPELDEQIKLLSAGEQSMIAEFRETQKLPDPLTDEFVTAVDQVFRRFEVRKISRSELIEKLFPAAAAATPDEIRERFDDFINKLSAGSSADRIRIVLSGED
jgi:hypothetical protein